MTDREAIFNYRMKQTDETLAEAVKMLEQENLNPVFRKCFTHCSMKEWSWITWTLQKLSRKMPATPYWQHKILYLQSSC